MNNAEIVAQLDGEIARLQQARALLVEAESTEQPKAKRGRPKGSTTKTASVKTTNKGTKRALSPEGRKAIADAMKRRWAERRKQKAK